jgi:hypothetical protein
VKPQASVRSGLRTEASAGDRGPYPRRAGRIFGCSQRAKAPRPSLASELGTCHRPDGAKPKGASSGARWQHRVKQRISRWSKALRLRAHWKRRRPGVLARRESKAEGESNSERATAAVTRSGCRGGKSFEGCMRHLERRAADGKFFGRSPSSELEMWRTPWPVAGCNRPAGPAWRKPSEPGGTARAEHARRLASSCRRAAFGPPGSGHAVLASAEGRSLMNPKRGVPTSTGSFGSQERDGPREPKRVSDREARSRELSSVHP